MRHLIPVLVLWGLACCGTPGTPEPVTRPPAPRPTSATCLARAGELERASARRGGDQQIHVAERLAREVARIRPHRPDGLARCEQRTERLLAELARAWKDGRDRPALQRAARLQQLYLELFPRGPRAYALARHRAEILFVLERWREAAEAYGLVVTMDRRGRHAEESARAAVVAWSKVVTGKPGQQDRSTAKPRPISDQHRQLITACDRFLKLAPGSTDVVSVLYRKARVYYEHGHHEQAIAGFAEIVTRHPDHEIAPHAGNLLLDALNILKRRDALKTWVERMLAEPRLARGEFAVTLTRLKRVIERRSVEKLVDRRQYDACARRYRALANRDPSSPAWPELIYNAAVCLERAGKRRLANIELKRLLGRRPEHALAPRALLMVAQNHEGLNEDAEAAKHFEQLAREYPGEAKATDALATAVALRLALRNHRQALADAELFARLYGRSHARRAARLAFLVGEGYDGKPAALRRHYASYIKKWANAGGPGLKLAALVKIAGALWRQSCPVNPTHGVCGRWREQPGGQSCVPHKTRRWQLTRRRAARVKLAREHLDRAIALHRQHKGAIKDDEAARGLGQARFLLAEQRLEGYLALRFTLDLNLARGSAASRRRLADYLAAKAKALEALRTSYQKVIRARQAATTLAAVARIGLLYQQFGEQIAGAPLPRPKIPADLRGARRDDFVAQLDKAYCDAMADKARPLLKSASEAFTACMRKAAELQVQNAWSRLCTMELPRTDRLRRALPKR